MACPHKEAKRLIGGVCPYREFTPSERNVLYERPAFATCHKRPHCGEPDWPPGHNEKT